MKPIITWFVDNPVASNLLMTILCIGGVMSALTVHQEEFPNIDPGLVQITVPYLGAAPEEVESGVCVRIEEAIEGSEGIKRINSFAAEGACSVMVELEEGVDATKALNQIKSQVDGINTFPRETERAIVSSLTVTGKVAQIALSGQTDERTLKELAMRIRDELAAMSGISQVKVTYIRDYEMAVEVSEETLRRYSLTMDQIARAIQRSSLDLPGGSIKTDGGEILLRTKGQAYRGAEFEDIVVVTRPDGTAITLGEIAHVVDGFQEGDLSVRFNGLPSAMVVVERVGDEDIIEIAEKVRTYVNRLSPTLPEGIHLDIWVDESRSLRDRINTLLGNAGGGLVLVLLVLTLFLRFRLAMWVGAGIPIAMLGALAMFPVVPLPISSLTVIGFILVLGIVVDDAIVVGERIHAHERNAENQRHAAIAGTYEVSVPVIFGVLTTMAAFLPLILLEGPMGQMFGAVGAVVVIALVFSIIESQLILPGHLAHRRIRTKGTPNPFVVRWLKFQTGLATWLENFAEHTYGGALKVVLAWRYVCLATGIGILVLVLSMIMSGRIVFGFFPSIVGNDIYGALSMPEGTPSEVTEQAAQAMEEAALRLKRELDADRPPGSPSVIKHVLVSVGTKASRSGGPRPPSTGTSSHFAEVAIQLVDSGDRGGITTGDVVKRWRALTPPIPDAVELTYSADSFSFGEALAVQLRGRDVDELRMAAAELRAEMARFAGVFDVTDSFRAGKQEVKLAMRPEAKALGLTLNDLGMQVRQAFYGQEAQRIQRGSEDVRVMVRYPESERSSLGDLEDMRIRTADGTEVPFASVADVTLGRGYSTINRIDRQRVVTVSADVDLETTSPEAIMASIVQDVMPRIFAKYPGVNYSLSGQQEERTSMIGQLGSLFGIALLVIYALLAIPLKSYIQPLIIMSVIPFGAVGAILGHWIVGWDLVMPSVLGMVALSGVVVNSSLVMVDYVNRQRLAGASVDSAVATAGVVRFRPIVLTSVTTFVGLIPLIMTASPSTAFIVPMAISLAFGVLVATFITLFLVPSLYLIMEDAIGERRRNHGAASQPYSIVIDRPSKTGKQ